MSAQGKWRKRLSNVKADNPEQVSRSRHDAILDAAAFQLANFGVGTATLPEIASCMGITRSALYYYVKSKEDLVYQVYRRSCDILVAEAERAAGLPIPAPDRIAAFVAGVSSRPQHDVIALNEVGMLEAEQQSQVMARYGLAVDTLAGIIADGMGRGELRRCDAGIAAHVIVSIVQQVCMVSGWDDLKGSQSPMIDFEVAVDRLVAEAINLVINGWATDRERLVPVDLIDITPLFDLPGSAFDREGLARAKRAEILTTASRMFNRRGVSSTTLDDIAAELGATKRTLYHHVGDKQAILSACHARSRDIILFHFERYDERVATGEDLLDAHVNYWRSTALAACNPQLEPLRLAVGLPEILLTERAAYYDFALDLATRWQRIHAALLTAGHMRAIDANAMGQIHIGSINWLAKGLITIEPSEQVQIVTEVIDLLRLGLKPVGEAR